MCCKIILATVSWFWINSIKWLMVFWKKSILIWRVITSLAISTLKNTAKWSTYWRKPSCRPIYLATFSKFSISSLSEVISKIYVNTIFCVSTNYFLPENTKEKNPNAYLLVSFYLCLKFDFAQIKSQSILKWQKRSVEDSNTVFLFSPMVSWRIFILKR